MSLRDRCKAMLDQLQRNAMLRTGSPVDDLMAFVMAETGRMAASEVEEALPLCLYFGNEKDRDEFIAIVREVKPNMTSRKVP